LMRRSLLSFARGAVSHEVRGVTAWRPKTGKQNITRRDGGKMAKPLQLVGVKAACAVLLLRRSLPFQGGGQEGDGVNVAAVVKNCLHPIPSLFLPLKGRRPAKSARCRSPYRAIMPVAVAGKHKTTRAARWTKARREDRDKPCTTSSHHLHCSCTGCAPWP